MTERDLIAALAAETGGAPGLVRGMGDDCAVIERCGDRVLLLSTDTLIEGVHWGPWHPPRLLGRKAVAVNLSDVAAMGGRPLYLLLNLGLPAGFDPAWFEEFRRGLREACGEYGCALIGGDTVRCPAGAMLSLTVIGEADRGRVCYRDCARPGDLVWVSGPLGEAGAGLELCRRGISGEGDAALVHCIAAHLDPRARVALGHALAASGLVHAMMDLSDGLATDLAHICTQSGGGAWIDAARLPLSPALERAAACLDLDPVRLMTSGGEDYELLFTTPADAQQAILELAETKGRPLFAIGEITTSAKIELLRTTVDGGRNLAPIGYSGWDHFA